MRYENKSSLFGYFCFEIALSKNPEIAAISFQRTIVRLCGGPATGATVLPAAQTAQAHLRKSWRINLNIWNWIQEL